ncbi:PREDICTED: uncharacterized protein LOC106816002 [Priapulus caudatus]|uniref:Uncharacterized protein LOC106816002 n=1 Tax=Priapulus caudatus TaxID=37621 RepID=A0ABM1EUZ9_PRICU|nr:PREDICTED: uncharacterized protein LOC106816002 [Priapulus caudatus]
MSISDPRLARYAWEEPGKRNQESPKLEQESRKPKQESRKLDQGSVNLEQGSEKPDQGSEKPEWESGKPERDSGKPERDSEKQSGRPRTRYKHAACTHGRHVYVHGGRSGTMPLRDLWRYDPASDTWTEIKHPQGESPPSPWEHTILPYKDKSRRFSGGVQANTNRRLSLPCTNHRPPLIPIDMSLFFDIGDFKSPL